MVLVTSCNQREIFYPEGGYPYPQDISTVDTNDFAYPLKDLVSSKDSFRSAYISRYWGRGYNEPNLSIKPLETTVFRLLYFAAFQQELIISITESEIVIKESKKGTPYGTYDSTKLSEVERSNLQLLEWNFPLQDIRSESPRKKRADSLITKYPELLNPSYYKYLKDKSTTFKPFVYTTKRIKISKNKFNKIIILINHSGYWKLPHKIECEAVVLDGYGIMLEANTARYYNNVNLSSCPGDQTLFRKACQEIINMANLDRKINLFME